MKKPELFHKTIGILVNAYFNNTLTSGDPCGCAIGNMILANNKDIKFVENKITFWEYPDGATMFTPYWASVHTYGEFNSNPTEKGIKELESTGYNIFETAKIEKAFEYGYGSAENDFSFNGLMSVCDILMQIHEATTEEITEAKALFVKELTV